MAQKSNRWRKSDRPINGPFVSLIGLSLFHLHLWVTSLAAPLLISTTYVNPKCAVMIYFAKPNIMLLKCFINVSILCRCIHCGVIVVYAHSYSPLGNWVFTPWTFALSWPSERFIYVARGFVTSETSTQTSVQSDGAKVCKLTPFWMDQFITSFSVGPCRGLSLETTLPSEERKQLSLDWAD